MVRRRNPHQHGVTHAERARAVDRIEIGLRDDRLDLLEYDERLRAVERAGTAEELAAQVKDLPERPGVREWSAWLRVRAGDRKQATTWLADALSEGSLTPDEYEQRLRQAGTAETYPKLRAALDGVAGPPDATREHLLVPAADRQALLSRLDRALADGGLGGADHAKLAGDLDAVRYYGDLDKVATEVDRCFEPNLRDRAVRQLDESYAAGQLDAAEHEARVAAVRTAERNADVKTLLEDLAGPPDRTLDWLLKRSPTQLAGWRVTDTARRQAADLLERSLRDGRIDLAGYEERSRRVYRAKVGSEVRAALADLADSAPPAPARAPRTGPRRRFPSRLLRTVAVVAVVVVGGGWAYGHLTGDDHRLPEVWSAPAEPVRTEAAIGNWFTGGLLVRARPDRMVAYDAASGQQRWVFQPPDNTRLCTLSRTTGGGVGLIGYGSEKDDKGCATVAAVDLNTGEALWRHERDLSTDDFRPVDPSSDEADIAGDVAVLRESGAFVALGLHGDGERWRTATAAASGCLPYSVTGAGDDVVLLSVCGTDTWRISPVDARSGQARWSADLSPIADASHRNPVGKSVVVLSSRPLAIRIPDDDGEQRGAVVSFDDQGRRRATIPLTRADDLELDYDDFSTSGPGFVKFQARPVRRLTIVDDTLVLPQRRVSVGEEEVAGYSLADGRLVWHTSVSDEVEAVAGGSGRVHVETRDIAAEDELRFFTLSAATGKRLVTDAAPDDHVAWLTGLELIPLGDRYLISVERAGGSARPVVLLGRG